MILNTIRDTIIKHKLIAAGDKILIGLSGGADSVTLTHVLNALCEELGITLFTAHINHGIRGDEAQRDEEFSESFSKSLGIKCHTLKADIPRIAKEDGISEEACGREVRYDFFKKICVEYGIDKIATAHNKNDNAETIVMNFIRGSSINGLAGIPYRRGNIIRPLLDVSREEIERYCEENGLSYMTDSTNSDLIYTRNKIRNKLIPVIKDNFNPNFAETICSNASLIREDSEYLEKVTESAFSELVRGNFADVKALLTLDTAIRRRVIRKMLCNAYNRVNDIPSLYISDILSLINKQSGASISLKDGITAKIEYGKLIIGQQTDKIPPFEYNIPQNYKGVISEISKEITISSANERRRDGAIYLSCDDKSVITVRNRRSGDVFYPCGVEGSKKVKEYFINEKIPREKRGSVPIIEIDGKIAAVGSRVDRRFLFKDKGIRIEFKALEVMD